MLRIFTKSIFTTFLIVLLFVNLLMFFNLLPMVFGGTGIAIDYTNKYVGFQTLYDFFTSGFTEDSSLLVSYQNFLSFMLDKTRYALYGSWQELINNPSGSGFLDVLRGIANTLMSIGSIFAFIFYGIFYLIYSLCVFAWIVIKFFSLISGMWYSTTPPNPYDYLLASGLVLPI